MKDLPSNLALVVSGGTAGSAIFGLTPEQWNTAAAIAGIFGVVLTVGINFYFRRKEFRLKEEKYHARKN